MLPEVNAEDEIIVTEEYAKEMREHNSKKKSYTETYSTTLVGTEYKTFTVTPSGQLAGGQRFSTGGGFYINTSGGSNVSFNASLSWGVMSVGVSTGSKINSGGIYVKAPTTTSYYKVKIDKKYIFRRYKINVYDAGKYMYTYYTSSSAFYSQNAYCVKV